MKDALVIRYHRHGNPEEVLSLEKEPIQSPGKDEVLVRLKRAVIHPSDLGMIAGTYGRLKTLPATGGREGVGEIVAVGPNVSQFKVSQWVRMPEETGTWRSHCTVNASALSLVPNDIPVDMAAMAFINPLTAWCLLHQFIALQPGDWVIQNAANSAVGFGVIQIAKQLGLKTINIVRDPQWQPTLSQEGATHVFLENSGWEKELSKTLGTERPKLGLNSVGGPSVIALTKALSDGGILVTFGGMSTEPIRFPTRYLIFNDIHYCGFWMDRWMRKHSKSEVAKRMDVVFDFIRRSILRIPVEASYPLTAYSDAIRHASQKGRKGKILFTGEWA